MYCTCDKVLFLNSEDIVFVSILKCRLYIIYWESLHN